MREPQTHVIVTSGSRALEKVKTSTGWALGSAWLCRSCRPSAPTFAQTPFLALYLQHVMCKPSPPHGGADRNFVQCLISCRASVAPSRGRGSKRVHRIGTSCGMAVSPPHGGADRNIDLGAQVFEIA